MYREDTRPKGKRRAGYRPQLERLGLASLIPVVVAALVATWAMAWSATRVGLARGKEAFRRFLHDPSQKPIVLWFGRG